MPKNCHSSIIIKGNYQSNQLLLFKPKSSNNFKLKCQLICYNLLLLVYIASLCGNYVCQATLNGQYKQPQVSISLILPQSFRVPTNELQGEKYETNKLQQYVALINNAQDLVEDEKLRQKYKKLTLQLRDARTPITGELFYEHVFDYFPIDSPKTLLIPVSLDQVSPAHDPQQQQQSTITNNNTRIAINLINRPQQLIVSIRPYQLNSGFGSDSIEFASSAPIPVEFIPSNDGRRSFAIVQTDKPIYKPDERVRIRSLVINENLRPITDDEIRLQIKNPHKVIVEEARFPQQQQQQQQQQTATKNNNYEQLYLDHTFVFPPEPMLGTWSVHLLHNDPVANDSTSFEVKEYVLPTFEIEFFSPKYILPSAQNITGAIIAKYHYGKPVQGKAQFKFGYKESMSSKPKFIARSSIKTIDPTTGRVEYKINSSKIQETDWFPSIAGSKFVVEATVTETSTGHREVAQDFQATFITHPYIISFEESIEDFKPGLSQPLLVQVLEMQTHRPAPEGVKIVAQYYDQDGKSLLANGAAVSDDNNPVEQSSLDSVAYTDSTGRASFNIGPIRQEVTKIQITLRWFNSSSSNNYQQANYQQQMVYAINPNELAVGHHTLIKHESSQGWISIMNKQSTNLNVGDKFVSDIMIRDALIRPQDIHYIIVGRGQILALDSINSTSGLISFTVTETMVPAIRLVLFAKSNNINGFISDSMKINVGQNLDCGLRVGFKLNNEMSPKQDNVFKPNDKGILEIKARQGDLVSLIGVDSAVYSLNNRSRIESWRVLQRIKRLDTGCGFGGGKNDLDVFHNAGLMFIRNFPPEQTASNSASYLGSSCLTVLNQLKHLEDIQLGYSRPMFTAAQSGRSRVLDLAASVRQRLINTLLTGGGGGHLNLNSESSSRKKRRSKREIDVEGLVNSYKDSFSRSCCRIGTLEDIPQKRNCSVRSKIVERYMSRSSTDSRCSRIYFECCRIVNERLVLSSAIPLSGRNDFQNINVEPTVRGRILGQQESTPSDRDGSSFPNVGHLDRIETQTLIRKDFRETWLFDLVYVEFGESVDSTNQLKTTTKEVQMPHSITSWSISAIALNKYQPMCIMPRALKLVTFQDIFIQLNMPYKVIQGEQIDLMATIFNYSPKSLEVFVYMYGVEDICSEAAEPNERSERKRIRLDKFSSQAVLFPIIPLKIGKYQIKILAITMGNDDSTSDIIERTLNVVPRGKVVTDETTFSLDPMNHQRRSKRAIQTGNLVDEIDSARGVQRSKVRLTPTRDSEFIVPQTQECIVSAIGDRFGHTVQTTLIDVENLIRLPHGCGEQVMIYLGPTLYTTRYLSSVNKLTGDNRWRAIRYIQSGYKRILNYRKENSGAFSAFARREPSIWLTAFIAKMLCQTERTPFIAEEIHVDKNVVNSALKWLIDMQNKETGAWIEMNPVYHREMLGGILKENALTAFVTLSLNECGHHASDLVEELELLSTPPPKLNEESETSSLSSTTGGILSSAVHQQQSSDGLSNMMGASYDLNSNSFRHSHFNGVNKLKMATEKAEQLLLLERYKAHKERNPYVLALTAYALSFSRPQQSIEVFNDLMQLAERSQSRNQLYWRGDYGIETAAYALQALIELGPLANQQFSLANNKANNNNQPVNQWQRGSDAIAIANWLSSRRSFTGAFESTQDTVVALEALSKFAQLQATPDNDLLPPTSIISSTTGGLQPSLVCNVTMTNNNRTKRSIAFGNDNAQILQTFKLDSFDIDTINGEMLDIITSGNGLGTMSVKLKYNVFQEEDELCRFDISSSIEEWHAPKIYFPPPTAGPLVHMKQQQNEQLVTISSNDNNETNIEDDYFKTFDKSMLNELNLYDLNQLGSAEIPIIAPGSTSNDRHILRVRRAPVEHHRVLDLSSKNDTSASEQDNSWTSKVVSAFKSNFASWGIVAKTTTTPTRTTTTTTTATPSSNRDLNLATLSNPTTTTTSSSTTKKTSTFRRSTQATPLSVQHTTSGVGPPSGAHMNPLSHRIDISNNNNETFSHSNSNATNSQQQQQQQSIIFGEQNQISSYKLVLLLKVCVNHMSTRKDSEMAVIEIGILSGFKPNEADLKEITNEIGTPAMHIETSGDKSIVIIYMKYIPFSGSYCLQFRLVRDSLVYNLQAGYIRAYEYYSPAHSCSNIYTPSRVANLLETKCDSSGQVCQCAAKSLCPATNKLLDLGEIHSVNSTSARNQLTSLVCSQKFDFVSLVKLKSVRYLEAGKIFKLSVKVKSDFKGNLTKIMEQQRKQKSINSIRKQIPITSTSSFNSNMGDNSTDSQYNLNVEDRDSGDEEGSSLDYLNLSVDSNCVRNDPLLLHLAHPNQWKQGGDLMILFGRHENLEKRFFKITSPKSSAQVTRASALSYPKPKPTVFNGITSNDLLIQKQQLLDKNQQLIAMFEDAQQLQYSMTLMLNKDSILHDIAYQAKIEPRETINNLILWLELRSRREKWVCPPQVN